MANLLDLDLLVRVDLEDEGVTQGYRSDWTVADFENHRSKIRSFVVDDDKGALIAVKSGASIGVILWRSRNLLTERLSPDDVFRLIGAEAFPQDGSFVEIFQLWVDPMFRRRGVGSALKLAVESTAREKGIGALYTHTEEVNVHVLELNRKLGYREVRRGPIWDEIIRVSLIKHL